MKLFVNAVTKFICGVILVGAMLFFPAFTFNYPGAWLFLGVLFIPMLAVGAVLLIKAPKLLEKRLDGKEKLKTQMGVVALAGLMFPLGFIISSLDFRFGWSHVSLPITLISAVLFLFGYILYAEVLRENEYLSRTVKVEEGQRVISTGLYGIVRHPMYLATVFMFLPIPMILGSFWGLIPFMLYPPIMILRLISEERILLKELEGYEEYKARVRYRFIPFVF